jgi:hypothetical protein
MPENFHALDKGTQGFICDLLHERDEARRQLKAAQTDQAIIRGQLTTADARVASKFSCISSFYCCSGFLLLIFLFSDLESQVQALLDAAHTATESVNTRGGTVTARLQNIPSRVREIAGYGAHQGAAVAIAMVSTMSGSDYQTFHLVFPEGEAREEFDELVDDLSVVADAIVADISLDTVIGSVFGEESD